MADQTHRRLRVGKGYLIGLSIFGGLVLLVVSSVIYLFATGEPSERGFSIDFEDCSTAQMQHLGSVYKAILEDSERFFDFPGLNRLTEKRELEIRRKLRKVWPLGLTCVTSDEDCRYGANTRG